MVAEELALIEFARDVRGAGEVEHDGASANLGRARTVELELALVHVVDAALSLAK